MLIEIDLNTCKQLQLTPNQLIFIKLLMSSSQTDLKEYLSVVTITQEDINEMIAKGILEPDTVIKSISTRSITEEFKIRSKPRELFDDFFEAFPKYIVRPDGTKDYLRTAMHQCRKLYEQKVGNSLSKHNTIIKCLNYEISLKMRTNKMSYFKRMPSWLKSEEWLSYLEMMGDTEQLSQQKGEMYGHDVE